MPPIESTPVNETETVNEGALQETPPGQETQDSLDVDADVAEPATGSDVAAAAE